MNFKVGDKVRILWEKTPYVSEYQHTGEVHSISHKGRIMVIVYRKSPLWRHSHTLAFHPEYIVPIGKEPKNGDML